MCRAAGRRYGTRFIHTVSAVHVPCYRKALRHSVPPHALLCLCYINAHHVQCKPAWAVARTTSGDTGPLEVCVRFMVDKVALTQVSVRKSSVSRRRCYPTEAPYSSTTPLLREGREENNMQNCRLSGSTGHKGACKLLRL